MTQYYEEPGLYTDVINPFDYNGLNWPFLKNCGFTWVTFQVYNPNLYTGVKTFDLAAVRAHGFTNVGIYGVIYYTSDFYNGGKKIGETATAQGAQHVKVDAEQCYKDTRVGKLGSTIIEGIRDGGWTGAVSLSTLGAPSNPQVNDFVMDTKSFTDTGGCIEPQDYYNDYAEYRPDLCKLYWNRVGVPDNRLNHTIGLYPGNIRKIKGAEWVNLLKEAKIGKNFSVYQAQDATKEDYLAFKDYIASIPTQNVPTPVSASIIAKTEMIRIASNYLNQIPNKALFSRIRIAKRILQSTDRQWNNVSIPIKNLLDDAGVSQ